MTDRQYDVLKTVALIAAPLIVFISSILQTWHVPYTAELTATFAAADAFLGALVKVAQIEHDKGGGANG